MTTQPAGEHHTGTLALSGQGNAPASPISDETTREADLAYWQRFTADEVQALNDDILEQLASMRAALEAAYPAIRQQVAEEIAAEADAVAEGHSKSAADHRAIALKHGTETPKGQRHMRTAHSFRDQAAGAWEAAHAARELGRGETL